MPGDKFLQTKGGYRSLVVYRVTEIVYDITYFFANKFLSKRDRTVDGNLYAPTPD